MIRKRNLPMIIGFLAPMTLCYLLVFLYPTVRTVVMSFFQVETVAQPASEWTFNGLDNYVKIFRSSMFLRSLQNIGLIWLVGGLLVMLTALLFAVILTSGVRGKSFFRSVIYLPNIVSAVALATMWLNYVYNPDYGLLHKVFGFLGLRAASEIMWTSTGTLFWSMLFAYCFGMIGYHMLIFMSGIERIGTDYYEAATIEGAGVFQKLWFITLPLLKGAVRTNLVMWTVSSVGFFVWSQLFSPINLSNDTVTPMNYMYELVFGGSSTAAITRDTGAGAAIGVCMAVIVVLVFFATTFIVKNDDIEL